MPKIHPIQTSFAAGIVTPELFGRIDSDIYKQGLSACQNFIPNTRGFLANRPGFEYKYRYENIEDARLYGFSASVIEAYLIVFTHEQIDIYNVANPVNINYITNGQFTQGGLDWDVDTGHPSASVTFEDDRANLQSGASAGHYAQIEQEITFPLLTDYELDLSGILGGVVAGLEISIGTTSGGTDIFSDTITGPVSLYTQTISVTANTVYLRLRQVGGVAAPLSSIHEIFFGSRLSAETIVTFDSGSPTPPPYQEDELPSINPETNPEGTIIYIPSVFHYPHKLMFDRTSKTWTFDIVDFTYDKVASTNIPEWVNSPPAYMTFYQGRSWWAGSIDYPSAIWGSESSLYENLGSGADVLDADAIQASTSKHGLIRWIKGTKSLIVGTELFEFSVISSDPAKDIVPTTFDIKQQTAYGSAPPGPIELGASLIFTTVNRQKIRAMWYNWKQEGWVAQDLSYASNSILNGQVRILTTLTHPFDMILCVLENGNVAICSYYREGNEDNASVGWSTQTTDGLYKSIASFQHGNHAELWTATQRIIEGVPNIFIERMEIGLSEEYALISGSVYMDAFKTDIFETPTQVITGLDHLEGKYIRAVVDGAVNPLMLVESGEVTLDNPGTVVHTGLPFLQYFQTLPLVVDDRYATTLGHLKRWVKLYLYLYFSVIPVIAGIRPPARHPSTLMNTAEPVIALGLTDSVTLGRERIQQVLVYNEIPLSCNVLAMLGELKNDSL